MGETAENPQILELVQCSIATELTLELPHIAKVCFSERTRGQYDVGVILEDPKSNVLYKLVRM